MSTRPEKLYPLFASLTSLAGIGPKIAKNLEKAGISRPRDLLMTLPASTIDRTLRQSVSEVAPPCVVTLEIDVIGHHPNRVKGRPYRVTVQNGTNSFQLVFFHARADWLARVLPNGARRVVSGKVELFDGTLQMVHPDHIVPASEAATIPAREPVYPLTAGVTQRIMYRASEAALACVPVLEEWIEPNLKAERDWPDWRGALNIAHRPMTPSEISPFHPARERLAYDELLAHQMTLALARSKRRRTPGLVTKGSGNYQRKVLKSLPYQETNAQKTAVSDIRADMAGAHRMNRLLQGDVGSGKTLVALLALLIAAEAGGQGVMMAPTEILARQHLETLAPMARTAGVAMDILTGRDSGARRQAKLAALADGTIQILLGTHAVFQKDVVFHDLRLAVIDEQHRFGVRQRMELGAKGQAVDVLVMTATPIPRSLALAQYGDMDISVLDEKPAGRLPVETVAIPAARLDEVIDHLQTAIKDGAQAYWVCPLVNESETLEWTAAAERHSVLRLKLGEAVTGLVHGQMPVEEKDAAMADFVAGRTKVLVATTVVEVGVDVPNATIMVIEQAENFGLAQLHQLRGRVGRGSARSTCLLLYTPPLGENAKQRLSVMRESDDGFRLADEDLRLRGAGDVLGVQQSGLPQFRVADLETQADLMKTAQQDARLLLQADPKLSSARGRAVRVLLYLMEQDKANHLLTVG